MMGDIQDMEVLLRTGQIRAKGRCQRRVGSPVKKRIGALAADVDPDLSERAGGCGVFGRRPDSGNQSKTKNKSS